MKFILFDIDGTLIDTGGAGTKSLNLAFEDTFGVREAFSTINMAGKTDIQIVNEGLKLHNISCSDNIVDNFCSTYYKYLKHNMNNGKGHIKPGIKDIVERIHSDKDLIPGLLTGNLEKGARIKLDFFGLNSYFETGAFGSDDEDRNNLLPIAVDRLYRHFSVKIGFSDCFVIGDTPRDISCSKPYGAFSIAVSTGYYSSEKLSEASPDILFENLSDTEGVLSFIKSI